MEHTTQKKKMRVFLFVIQLFLSPMLFERRLKYLCSLCDEFTRLCGVSCFVFESSRRSSLSSSSFVSIGSGERQQSSRLRGFVEDRNERIQRGKRPRLPIKTDIVFFSLSLSFLSLFLSRSTTKRITKRGENVVRERGFRRGVRGGHDPDGWF